MHNIRNRNNPTPRLRLDPNVVWEDRKTLVMRETEAKRAADDANTRRLRALRLEKEAADRLAAADAPPPARKGRVTAKA
jgi:hypothetical protein